jgi:flagellin-like protein
MQKLKKKRGISPIIATLLLIAIAVAAAVVTYSWVMSMTATESSQSQTSIKIDFVQFDSSDNTKVYVTVRNSGAIPATIDKIFITYLGYTGYGTSVDTLSYGSAAAGKFSDSSATVSVAGTTKFTCQLSGTVSGFTAFTTGQPYKIEVITNTGFSTTGTYYK